MLRNHNKLFEAHEAPASLTGGGGLFYFAKLSSYRQHPAKEVKSMARKNTGLPMGAMPNKASFTYGRTGARSESATRIIKGGDLRARKGLNNGR